MERIGRNVKTARLRANLTQTCLGDMVGVHWQTVSNLELGNCVSSPITIFNISLALHINVNRLFAGLSKLDEARVARIKEEHAPQRKLAKAGRVRG